MTDVMRVDPDTPDPDAIAQAAECLRRGGLVAFPTETVYGLGAHALDPGAVRRLFTAKQRPSTDPLIVHVAGMDGLHSLVRAVPASARTLGARFWPGPLTLILARSSAVPDEVTAGLDTVAVRVPAHPVARALLAVAAIPIAAPSANLFSRPSPTSAAHVLEDLEGRIDLVIDAGPTRIGVESTVLDLSGETPVVLRPGAITLEMLRGALPRVDISTNTPHDSSAPMVSPGRMEKHYSPRAPLTVYEGDPDPVCRFVIDAARRAQASGARVGVIAADEDTSALRSLEAGALLRTIGSRREPEAMAARLYAALRELDAAGADVILVAGLPDPQGLGLAVQDRLRKAAAGRVVHC